MAKHRAHQPQRPAHKAASPRTPWLVLNAPAGISESSARLYTRLAYLLAALLALALAWVVAGPHRVGDAFTETDFYGAYADGARLIQQGHLDPRRYGVIGPGYELVLALFGLPFRNLFLAAEVLSIVSTVGAWLLWFALLSRRVDARLGLITGAFLAVNPTFFRYGYSASTDSLAMALQALALYLLLTRVTVRGLALAGVAAAAAFLTRYNAIYLLPAGWLAIGLGGVSHEPRGRAVLAFTAGFLAPVVPWVAFSLAHGGVLGTQLHHNIAYDVFARARGIPWDTYQERLQKEFPTLWSVIARDPGAVLRRELFNVFDHLRSNVTELLGWPVAICAGLGVAFAVRDGTIRKLWPLLAAGGLLFLTLVPAFYSERYSLPLVPVFATFAATLFASPVWALVIGRARKLRLKPALALIPLGVSLFGSIAYQRQLFTQLPVEVLPISRTLKALARPGDRVIARKGHIGFHSGVALVPFPFTKTLPELGRYARENHARWLYFSWLEAELRPEYEYLLDTTATVPGLAARHATVLHTAVLYEIGPELGVEPAWMRSDTLVAEHRLRARLLIQPMNGEALYQLALIERARGEYAAALGHLERAARIRPDLAPVWLLVGDLQLKLNDPASADRSFVQALTLDPGNSEAQVGRGWASLFADRPEDAAAHWRPVVAEARDPITLQRMIQLYGQLGDTESESRARATLARLGAAR